MFSPRAFALVAAALLVGMTGCAAEETTKTQATGGGDITVDASDTACSLSTSTSPVGKRTFVVTNSGTKVTEFYVYGTDNAVLAEVENISPGLKRTLDVDFAKPGTYRTSCKPGMVGDGISAQLMVTG